MRLLLLNVTEMRFTENNTPMLSTFSVMHCTRVAEVQIKFTPVRQASAIMMYYSLFQEQTCCLQVITET